LAALSARVTHVFVFHVSEKCASERWLTLAARFLPNLRVGGGTDAYFAELNRNRPTTRLALVAYSVNPQVHAFDNRTLVESLEAQGATVESARSFLGEMPIAVTPVTLKPRYNPNATGAEPPVRPDELPPQVDVRQMSLFGAAWTLGSVKYLSEAGAHSVTYFETVGWRGVMERERGGLAPKEFRSIAGGVFPLYHALADVSDYAGGEVQRVVSSEPLRVDALLLRREENLRLLLMNFTDAYQVVRVDVPELGRFVRVKSLDASNAEAAMREPESYREASGRLVETEGDFVRLTVAPHGILRVEPASLPEPVA
jgi:hypothetical protein